MAAELVPIRLGLTAGDLYTLWAPRWRDAGDEWEALLGRDEDVYAFHSVADLAAFVRTDRDNDLTDHPAWEATTGVNAHRLDPDEQHRFDLVAVEELLAEKPTEESVAALAGALAIASSIGSVCELPAVTKFFNGNPSLSTVNGGLEEFKGKAGLKRWNGIAATVGRSWDNVVGAIDEVVSTPEVDRAESAKAQAELDEPAPVDPDDLDEDLLAGEESLAGADTDEDATEEAAEEVGAVGGMVLGGDEDFWLKVGIDPIRIMTASGTLFTLRCYLDDRPIFLGRNGRISVFGSERALARYLADEHDHDLSDLSTYDDIRTAATDGSLDVSVADENVYVLTGLADDLADGPEAVDREQLGLAVELLQDVGDYSEEDVVDDALAADSPLATFIGYVGDPDSRRRPRPPYAEVVEEFERLERFLESRLRRE
ncbi:protein export chaperone SatS [Mycolicibacterium palauense]|uniref:protein export chaperone SatS n=1 Tax=Mycolicibacterium palauense TaxID=2034511 RepID=UPI000BFEB884|nr:primosomal protein [Mycolicibacterium palauense]